MVARRRVRALAAGVALVLLAGTGWRVWSETRPDAAPLSEADAGEGPADYRYVIPAGTYDLVNAGGDVQILPRSLAVHVGDTIEIENRDSHTAQAGVYVVQPGQTVRQRFTTPGELTGACTVHPGGVFTITVHDA